ESDLDACLQIRSGSAVMKIHKNSVMEARPLELDEELDFSQWDFSSSYPLLGIKDAHVDGIVERNDEFLTANLYVCATLILSDARTCEAFEEPVEVEDIYDLLDSPEQEGDGYIFEGKVIELEQLVYSILRSQVPIAPRKEDSELPKGGEGYEVYSADGAEVEPETSRPFDEALKNY
ncbi:MAG: hypothetical protein K6F32_06635, partial [Bacilli bacterium]|nr:hypothetical protein [Bacilli bacterium]